jgi:hypothetical protein
MQVQMNTVADDCSCWWLKGQLNAIAKLADECNCRWMQVQMNAVQMNAMADECGGRWMQMQMNAQCRWMQVQMNAVAELADECKRRGKHKPCSDADRSYAVLSLFVNESNGHVVAKSSGFEGYRRLTSNHMLVSITVYRISQYTALSISHPVYRTQYITVYCISQCVSQNTV